MIRRDVLKSIGSILAIPTAGILGSGLLASAMEQENGASSDPWSADETVTPAAFAKELADPSRSDKPTIVCVGFRNFYGSAHIPGASYHGPASSDAGLADLKQYAQGLPRTTDLVIYCGCCPLAHCPNVRPAFIALRNMGFSGLRLLTLTHSFAADWLKPSYPVAKSE